MKMLRLLLLIGALLGTSLSYAAPAGGLPPHVCSGPAGDKNPHCKPSGPTVPVTPIIPPISVVPVIPTPPVVIQPPVVVTPPVVIQPPVVITPPTVINPPVVVTPPVVSQPPVAVTPPTVITPPVTVVPVVPPVAVVPVAPVVTPPVSNPPTGNPPVADTPVAPTRPTQPVLPPQVFAEASKQQIASAVWLQPSFPGSQRIIVSANQIATQINGKPVVHTYVSNGVSYKSSVPKYDLIIDHTQYQNLYQATYLTGVYRF